MAKPVYIRHEEVLRDAWKDPAFRREYLLLKPRYDLVRELINFRYRRGLTQADLAKKARTHQSRISKIESAEHDVTLSTLVEIADALDADVDIHLVPRQEATLFAEIEQFCASPSDAVWDVSAAGVRLPVEELA